jgi:hypothetical protein
VRVAVSGAGGTGADGIRYVLDGLLTRRGSARLTFTDLASGRHRLTVVLVSNGGVRAATVFTVPTPPPPPAPAAAPASTSPPAPSAAPLSAPAPMTAPAPAPMTSGIPQNNGGDMDGDNNGGVSDGDGGT